VFRRGVVSLSPADSAVGPRVIKKSKRMGAPGVMQALVSRPSGIVRCGSPYSSSR
jgi:hypothetical protein